MSILRNIYRSLSDQPLFLPRGSVRAIIALTAVGTWVYLTVSGLAVSAEFYAILGAIIAWYFSARENGSERELITRRIEALRKLYLAAEAVDEFREGEEG